MPRATVSKKILHSYCRELIRCPDKAISDSFARTLFTKGARCKKKKQPAWFMKLAKAVREGRVSIKEAKKPLSAMQGGGFIAALAATIIPGLLSMGYTAIKNIFKGGGNRKLSFTSRRGWK